MGPIVENPEPDADAERRQPSNVRRANAYAFAREMAVDLGIPADRIDQWSLAWLFEDAA